jgi:hypothetical protein
VSDVAGTNLLAHWTFDSDLSSTVNNNLYAGTAVVATGSGSTVHSDSAAAGGAPYVSSVFDVVHDHGGRTAFYAGWNGFNFLNHSWDADSGAVDTIGADDGTDKIDNYVLVTNDDIHAQTTTLINDLSADPANYSLIHWHKTDARGHGHGWTSAEYLDAVRDVDAELGRLIDFINADPTLAGNTAIVLNADHGGFGTGHGDLSNPEIYTIPLYVWVAAHRIGEELYELNTDTRQDPGNGRPDYSLTIQPIRNGDAANLALDLLGLDAVPGSAINDAQDLNVSGYPLGDLNFDGSLNFEDWLAFLAGHGGDFGGLPPDDAYAMGDLDGDLDNDLDDFVMFYNAYDAINGAGSMAGLLTAPEPSSAVLAAAGLGCVCVASVVWFRPNRARSLYPQKEKNNANVSRP